MNSPLLCEHQSAKGPARAQNGDHKEVGKQDIIIDPTEHRSPDFDISKMMNVVMLGYYAEFRGYAHEGMGMSEIIKESAPPQFH
jgi:indolepyruvate ferredoxin oxidoreductase beta subunit